MNNSHELREIFLTVPGPREPIPLWIFEPQHRAGTATILFYHGLKASKNIQRKELEHLARHGFRAVGVDAVGHGDRRWSDFDQRLETRPAQTLLEIVRESAAEVGTVVDFLSRDCPSGSTSFGLAGISMGGFIAFAAALCEERLSAVVSILGSPDWHRMSLGSSDDLEQDLLARSPHLHPDAFSGKALLALNAGRDYNVSPEPARRFIDDLKRHFPEQAHRFEYLEYPESEHCMRPQDWDDLLERVADWFTRFT